MNAGSAARRKEQSGVRLLPNRIGGREVFPAGRACEEVLNPATGELLAQVPLSGAAEVSLAVEAAAEAFGSWSRVPVPKRARVLFRYWQLLQDHAEELAALITAENGKSLREAAGEVQRGIECVEFAAGAPSLMMGTGLGNIAPDLDSSMLRVPLGVVAGITPFNFPMMVPCWMFPLAVACGNTFVLKPSERTPLTAMKLAALLEEAGLPPGVLNLVHGGYDAVNALTEHDKVKALSFVGSQPAALSVYRRGTAAGKRVQALSGAKNYHIVMPDAHPEKAVENIIASAFGSAGERCMACSAVVVVGEGDAFVGRLAAAAAALTVGPGADPDSGLTPVIREEHRERIRRMIERGVAEGARLVLDGRGGGLRPAADPSPPLPPAEGAPASRAAEAGTAASPSAGFFLGPTLFDGVRPEMSLAQEEIFGPVLSVLRAADLDEALAIANESRFGNSAVLYTDSARAIRQFREEAEAGMLGVNVGVPAPMAFFPFSGWKDSFYGDLHANGRDGVEFYTKKKMITSRCF
ncbi:malonate-semialdehyde dehydrogenase (acetylating)/methylmalonate-semialdehyde dehydrogenase [Paenibacillus mucilaginosus]|uniref:CoA-acylating methylmalonate-semialdehyde dehydrogenase n=1 Tax=Paenibacillus mucilaginosus TaxID=61624 RepID=UPI003D1F9D69